MNYTLKKSVRDRKGAISHQLKDNSLVKKQIFTNNYSTTELQQKSSDSLISQSESDQRDSQDNHSSPEVDQPISSLLEPQAPTSSSQLPTCSCGRLYLSSTILNLHRLINMHQSSDQSPYDLTFLQTVPIKPGILWCPSLGGDRSINGYKHRNNIGYPKAHKYPHRNTTISNMFRINRKTDHSSRPLLLHPNDYSLCQPEVYDRSQLIAPQPIDNIRFVNWNSTDFYCGCGRYYVSGLAMRGHIRKAHQGVVQEGSYWPGMELIGKTDRRGNIIQGLWAIPSITTGRQLLICRKCLNRASGIYLRRIESIQNNSNDTVTDCRSNPKINIRSKSISHNILCQKCFVTHYFETASEQWSIGKAIPRDRKFVQQINQERGIEYL